MLILWIDVLICIGHNQLGRWRSCDTVTNAVWSGSVAKNRPHSALDQWKHLHLHAYLLTDWLVFHGIFVLKSHSLSAVHVCLINISIVGVATCLVSRGLTVEWHMVKYGPGSRTAFRSRPETSSKKNGPFPTVCDICVSGGKCSKKSQTQIWIQRNNIICCRFWGCPAGWKVTPGKSVKGRIISNVQSVIRWLLCLIRVIKYRRSNGSPRCQMLCVGGGYCYWT